MIFRALLERLLACAELNHDDLEPETIALLDEIDDVLYPIIKTTTVGDNEGGAE
jgi:hypothetical protein